MTTFRTHTDPSTRETLNDFVYAVDNPTSDDAYFNYTKVNTWVDEINYAWDAFQFVHTKDGDHRHLIQIDNFIYISDNSIKFSGSVDISAGELVKLDIDGTNYYEMVYGVYYNAGNDETTIVLEDVVSGLSNLDMVYLRLVRDVQTLPVPYDAVYRSNDTSNLLGSSGDWESDVIEVPSDVTRLRAFGHFYLDGAAQPELLLYKSDGSWAVVATFSLDECLTGLAVSQSDEIKVKVSGADGVICMAFGFEYGG